MKGCVVMKITGLAALQTLARPTNQRENAPKQRVSSGGDSFHATDELKSFQSALKTASAASSDVRSAKIADIQERIQAGTYSVSAFDIASKLVDARA